MAVTKATVLDALSKYKTREDAYNASIYVAKVSGKGLSTNDYTTAEKNKLAGIASGAQTNAIEIIKINGTTQTVADKTVNLDLSDYVKGTDIASAYIHKGSVNNFAALPTDTSVLKTGYVYNVANAGGTDANGTAIKAGDNVCWNGSGWDALAGTTDLSAYVQTTALTATLTNYVSKDGNKVLSTNDFSAYYKGKLDDLINGADEQITDAEIANLFNLS